MPGVWAWVDPEGLKQSLVDDVVRAASLMEHDERFRTVRLEEGSYLVAGETSYAGYPLWTHREEDSLVLFEGFAAGESDADLRERLIQAARRLGRREEDGQGGLQDWLRSSDGDFVVLLFNRKAERCVVANDPLGRLPLYVRRIGRGVSVAREMKFATHLFSSRSGASPSDCRIDSLGLGQFLLLGYPLGQRTLLEDAHRLSPGSILDVDLRSGRVLEECYYPWLTNSESLIDGRFGNCRGSVEWAERLSDLFLESCKQRAKALPGHEIVLSLSGGLDSRAVAAGLRRIGSGYRAATFDAPAVATSRDAEVAERIADALDVPWDLFRLEEGDRESAVRILRYKDGLNSAGMSFILPFFDHLLKTIRQPSCLWTGDGGDKLLPPQLPSRPPGTLEVVMDELIGLPAIFSAEEAEEMTGLAAGSLRRSVRECLESYPEPSPADRMRRFLVRERAFKWLFEGEDRTRSYFPSLAPFWSRPLVEAAWTAPEEVKAGHVLYREFLRRIGPEVADLPNARWGESLSGGKGSWRCARSLFDRLPAGLRYRIKNRIRSRQFTIPADRMELLDDSLSALGFDDVLDVGRCRLALRQAPTRSRFEHLLTIALYLRGLREPTFLQQVGSGGNGLRQ